MMPAVEVVETQLVVEFYRGFPIETQVHHGGKVVFTVWDSREINWKRVTTVRSLGAAHAWVDEVVEPK